MKFRSLAGTTALAMVLAQAAVADVTPAQVWQDWQELSASYGQILTPGAVDDQGGVIVVSDLAISYDRDDVKASGTIAELRFADRGDGSVEITLSDTYPLSVTVPPETAGGNPTTIALLVEQPGLVITAAGDGTETSYDFAGPSVRLSLTGIEGVEAEAVDLTAAATLVNVAGKYIFAPDGAKRSLNSSFAADSLTIEMAGRNPDPTPSVDGSSGGSSGSAKISFAMDDITGTTNGTILDAAAMADMAAALKAGFATDGSFTAGKTSYDIDISDAAGSTKITGTGETTSFGFAMDERRLAYSGSGTGVTTTITSPDIPFPSVTLTYAEAGFDFLMPVSPSDAPADFALMTRLVDFSISDAVWDLFDPTKQLPRDPATLIIDTKGTATLTASLFDTAAMEAVGTTPPGQLNSLEITELRASIAGADLTGKGAFTFDNSDLTTYQGMPVPTGKIDLKLVGANTLMDKLVAMGLMPEDQVMGIRMMLSMFANATGEDELSSTIEFKDKGFFANGQRLK